MERTSVNTDLCSRLCLDLFNHSETAVGHLKIRASKSSLLFMYNRLRNFTKTIQFMERECTSAFQVDKELKPLKIKLVRKRQWNLCSIRLGIKRVLEDINMDSSLRYILSFMNVVLNILRYGKVLLVVRRYLNGWIFILQVQVLVCLATGP
jgi:hypothetical protein